jgi:type II secretory pathway pseudopilin PulG
VGSGASTASREVLCNQRRRGEIRTGGGIQGILRFCSARLCWQRCRSGHDACALNSLIHSMTSLLQGKLLAQRSLFQRLQSSKRLSKLGQAGFTLIELLIAIPNLLNTRDSAEQKANQASASAAARACATAILTGANPLPTAPTGPGGDPPTAGTCAAGTAITYGVGLKRGSAIPAADGTITIQAPEAPPAGG